MTKKTKRKKKERKKKRKHAAGEKAGWEKRRGSVGGWTATLSV